MTLVPTHLKTVLVVEDDPWTRAVLKALLVGDGFAVLEADSGEAGLRLAKGRRPHAILLDLTLTTLSGAEVLHELKRAPTMASIPVIGLRAYSGLMRRQQAPQAHAVVDEPFDYDELLNHVERVTGRLPGNTSALSASHSASRLVAAGQPA